MIVKICKNENFAFYTTNFINSGIVITGALSNLKWAGWFGVMNYFLLKVDNNIKHEETLNKKS
jgi:hypothetical protein